MSGGSRTSVVRRPDQPPRGRRQAKTGQYLYAIVDASHARRDYGRIGVDGRVVYAISSGPLAAVVSDVPQGRIRPERRHLAAHHQVLKRLVEDGAALPMAFGVIAQTPKAIRRILHLNQAAFVEQLRRVEGKVEMALRVVWDVPNIFEYIVAVHPELRALRDRLFGGGREPSHTEKIALGRRFEQVLNEDRAVHTENVAHVLQSRCAEIRQSAPRHEREVMNLACLIQGDALDRFEDGVFEAARLFDDNFSFDFNGPWPPFNFVEVELQA